MPVDRSRRAPVHPDQLAFPLEEPARDGRLPVRIPPMVATDGSGPFDDPDYLFEPWWPGARTILFLDGGELRAQSDHLADPLRSLRELPGFAANLVGDGLAVGGVLLVLDDEGRPDRRLLRERLEVPAVIDGQPAFVAEDLLYRDGRSLRKRPFVERRARLADVVRESDQFVVGRGFAGDGLAVATAVAELGFEEMSARRLDAPHRSGDAGGDWLRLPLVEAAPTSIPPLLTVIRRLPL